MIEYPIKFELHLREQKTQFIASPDTLYELMASGLKDKLKINPNADEVTKTLTRAMRATLKATLIAFGPGLLDLMFKSKDHPKPGKKDDLVEWYADILAKFLVADATRGTLILKAAEGEYGQDAPIIINQICPIPMATSARGGDEGEGTGTESRPENPDSTP